MSLNLVTVTWDRRDFTQDAVSGSVTFAPAETLTDATDGFGVEQLAKTYFFADGTGESDPMVATDNANLLPSGWTYTVTVAINGLTPYSFNTFIAFANGATQKLSSLIPLSTPPVLVSSLPLPSGTAQAGYVPVATGSGEASAWGAVAQLDATAADIQALGTRAAGSVGKAADAGHVHPTTGMLTKVADTGTSGYTLINGSGTILSWTAPNDGQMHTVSLFSILVVSSTETGGQVNVQYTDMGGNVQNAVWYSAALGVGSQTANNAEIRNRILLAPGNTLNITQSALTGGAAKLYAQIWAV